MIAIKQAIVLAAGLGTRLSPLTLSCPKPLISVRGRPLLDSLLDQLTAFGIPKIVINTHHLAEQIHQHVQGRSGIHISYEPEILGTGGGIEKALPFFEGHPFFVINGDTYWNGTLGETLQALQQSWSSAADRDALLALVPQHLSGQNGDYDRTPSGHLLFQGKNAGASYTYSGLSLLHPRLFDHAPGGKYCVVKGVFHLAEAQQRLFGLEHKGFWSDVGTHAVLNKLQELP